MCRVPKLTRVSVAAFVCLSACPTDDPGGATLHTPPPVQLDLPESRVRITSPGRGWELLDAKAVERFAAAVGGLVYGTRCHGWIGVSDATGRTTRQASAGTRDRLLAQGATLVYDEDLLYNGLTARRFTTRGPGEHQRASVTTLVDGGRLFEVHGRSVEPVSINGRRCLDGINASFTLR